MELTDHIDVIRQFVPGSKIPWQRIRPQIGHRPALFDQSSKSPSAPLSDVRINRDNPFCITLHLFDFGIHQFEGAATCCANLPVEVELGFAFEPLSKPSLIEPHHLQLSACIIDETIHDVKPSPRNPPYTNRGNTSANENPVPRCDRSVERRHPRTILIATREVEQEIADSAYTFSREGLSRPGSDSFESGQGVVGAQGRFVGAQSPLISKRH